MARKMYRIAEPNAHVVTDPDSGHLFVPDARRAYPEDHPLVREYRWMFVSDSDVEDASAEPGHSRWVRRGDR